MKKISFMFVGGVFAFANITAISASAQSADGEIREGSKPVEAAGDRAVDAMEQPPTMSVPPIPRPPRIGIASGNGAQEDKGTKAFPETRASNWITQADYPATAWVANEEGRTEYDVTVSDLGKPTDCKISSSSGSAVLDEATCQLVLERAEFKPAISADGVQIEDVYQGSHFWRKKEPEMPQMRIVFQYLHTAEGVTTDCDILSIEGDIPEKMRADIERDRERGRLCSGSIGRPGIPYRDEYGVPVAKRVTATINVVLEDPE